MKRIITILLAFMMICTLLIGCTNDKEKEPIDSKDSEIVDGKFVTTRTISVEVFDRGNDGVPSRRIMLIQNSSGRNAQGS